MEMTVESVNIPSSLSTTPIEWKELGNQSFKAGLYEKAIEQYTQGISLSNKDQDKESMQLLEVLYTNRAAVYLKNNAYQLALNDCNGALFLNKGNTKALYRAAQASYQLKDNTTALNHLSQIIHMDPKNNEAISLMRDIRKSLAEQTNNSPIFDIISSYEKQQQQQLQKSSSSSVSTTSTAANTAVTLEIALVHLTGLCSDDKSHALELGRMYKDSNNNGSNNSGVAASGDTIAVNGLTWLNHQLIHQQSYFTLKSSFKTETDETNNSVGTENVSSSVIEAQITHATGIVHKILRCLTSACIYPEFVTKYIDIYHVSNKNDINSSISTTEDSVSFDILTLEGKISFQALCNTFISFAKFTTSSAHSNNSDYSNSGLYQQITQTSISLAIQILKNIPLTLILAGSIDDDNDDNSESLYMTETAAKSFLHSLVIALLTKDPSLFSLASEAVTAFISESPEYLNSEKIVDSRMESLEDRNKRLFLQKMLRKRSFFHAKWALDCLLFDVLMITADDENALLRQRSSICIARLMNALSSNDTGVNKSPNEVIKNKIMPYIDASNCDVQGQPVKIVSLLPSPLYAIQPHKSSTVSINTNDVTLTYHPIELIRRRATLEAALLTCTHGDIGIWALQQYDNGIKQLLLLVVSGELRCQEVASEVMCLTAATENGSPLLAPLLSTGALQSLLQSPSQSVRAAAASTMTKLSIKAKALDEQGPELSEILNAVLNVLKSSPLSTLKQQPSNIGQVQSQSKGANNKESIFADSDDVNDTSSSNAVGKGRGSSRSGGLVSFSKLDSYDTQMSKMSPSTSTTAATSGSGNQSQQQKAKKVENDKLRIHSGVSTGYCNPSVNKSTSIGNNSTTTSMVDFTSSLGNTQDGASFVSTDRAIEVLASLIGKTLIKEEIVHGSYRVAPAITALLALDLDMRSTAAYGLAHILAALTVSNNELRAKALAEKDMTPEQYEKLVELQRIKTEDDNGNKIEEKKEATDFDTNELVKRRIQRIVTAGGLPILIKLIANGSNQTKEAAARALRQICVDDSCGARGLMIQQGGLKTCCSIVMEDHTQNQQKEITPKAIKLECAHAIAKTLITTNPMLLSEHLRLGAIPPLVYLCRDVDANNLQQFEALMSLTNLTSCGEVEQNKLVQDKGVAAVHYLMFSEHPMVRRAATEALTNMALHESVLKILRAPEQVRLWLGLGEEFDKECRADVEEEDDEEAEEGNVKDKKPTELPVDEEIVSEGVQRMELLEEKEEGDNTTATTAANKNKNKKLEKVLQQLQRKNAKIVLTESYKTARAAAATLAVASCDQAVGAALLIEKVGETYTKLLYSMLPELIHRILVSVIELCNLANIEDDQSGINSNTAASTTSAANENKDTTDAVTSSVNIGLQLAQHFIDEGIVPAIAVVTRMNDVNLGELAKEAAAALSSATAWLKKLKSASNSNSTNHTIKK